MVQVTKLVNLPTVSSLKVVAQGFDLPVVKAFNNEELNTLDLSVGNIEKAYEAFRQEQLEKLAYDNLQKSFAAKL